MVTIHLAIRLEAVCPDLSQPLGEVFSLLNYWIEIAFVVDTTLPRITRSESWHAATSVS